MQHVEPMTPVESLSLRNALVVDLDGTVVKSDTLWELFSAALYSAPLVAVTTALRWMFHPQQLKARLAEIVDLDVRSLPYDTKVLEFVRARREAGSEVILATAAGEAIANAVADFLGLFDKVISSTASVNAKGDAKLRLVRDYLRGVPFDYLGDSVADEPLWRNAKNAYVAGATKRVTRVAGDHVANSAVNVISTKPSVVSAFLAEIRWRQWVKNVLVFFPLLAAHSIFHAGLWGRSFLVFGGICLLASAVYIINDLGDISADRHHPTKQFRPLASGSLPIAVAMAAVPIFILLGLTLSAFAGRVAAADCALYFLVALGYSIRLKRMLILDATALAALYTLRMFVGSAATGIPLSFWLLAFALFLFLGLAFLKRYSELRTIEQDAAHGGRGYIRSDEGVIRELGLASSFSAIGMFALYLNSQTVTELYAAPSVLWLLVPIMLYWIGILWVRASRGELVGDPVMYALKHKESVAPIVVGALVIILSAVGHGFR